MKLKLALSLFCFFSILSYLIWRKHAFKILAGWSSEAEIRIKNRKQFAAFNGISIFLYGVWSMVCTLLFMEKTYSSLLFIGSTASHNQHTNDRNELFSTRP
ncbi:hypothetical protein CHH64_00650 [Terribacillus saccharophilus]|uniref:DUF3784 domain-containing protein n=1 Tax=Terribacillus saccharophilus TaxID=361277 RepID=A0A268ADS0_9BACI|nr:hypothetical protein CHH64_00650 [Terribacillus saccharophilus]